MKLLILTLAVLTLSSCDDLSFAYTDEQLVMAIYHAEGGSATKYPFGIRSVYCATYANCKRCCEKTVRHNRRRFAQSGYKRYKSYLECLASVYCPCEGGALTPAERRLNRYWIRNVNYFLTKENSNG